jgi:glycosyltransferase involved in cell wall biosynthesis
MDALAVGKMTPVRRLANESLALVRIGFACLWDRDAASTWSRTPWELRRAMREQADVVDVGIDLSMPVRRALQSAHLKYRNGELITLWEQGALTDRYCQRQINRRSAECDVVLQIQDLAITSKPFYVYQDMSFDALLKLRESGHDVFRVLTTAEMQRRHERQRQVYEKAAGVIAMSHWLAESLVKDSGLAPEKVHVVQPGRVASVHGPVKERPKRRHRLLFVGRTFASKGGDLVLQAFERLRQDGVTLTIVGPPTMENVPEGVNFLGAIPSGEVAKLYDEHDLFVLPTRIEGFGIVFAEALSRGLPCIGRNNFAMPEIIQAPRYGRLLSQDDPQELADLISDALADDALYERCRDDAALIQSHYSWERAAREAIRAVGTWPKG